jgi:hypothetical protein
MYATQLREESGMGAYNHPRSKSPTPQSVIRSEVNYDKYMHHSKERNPRALNEYDEWKYEEDANNMEPVARNSPSRNTNNYEGVPRDAKPQVNYAISYDKNLQPENIKEKVKKGRLRPPRGDENRQGSSDLNYQTPNNHHRNGERENLSQRSPYRGDNNMNPNSSGQYREHNYSGYGSNRDGLPNNNSYNFNYNNSTLHNNSSHNNPNYSHNNDSNLYDVDKNVRTIIEYKNNMIDHLERCKGSRSEEGRNNNYRPKYDNGDIPKTYIDYRQPDIIYEEHHENQKDLSYSGHHHSTTHPKVDIAETADFSKTVKNEVKDVSFMNRGGNEEDNINPITSGEHLSSYTPSERNKGKTFLKYRPIPTRE